MVQGLKKHIAHERICKEAYYETEISFCFFLKSFLKKLRNVIQDFPVLLTFSFKACKHVLLLNKVFQRVQRVQSVQSVQRVQSVQSLQKRAVA